MSKHEKRLVQILVQNREMVQVKKHGQSLKQWRMYWAPSCESSGAHGWLFLWCSLLSQLCPSLAVQIIWWSIAVAHYMRDKHQTPSCSFLQVAISCRYVYICVPGVPFQLAWQVILAEGSLDCLRWLITWYVKAVKWSKLLAESTLHRWQEMLWPLLLFVTSLITTVN